MKHHQTRRARITNLYSEASSALDGWSDSMSFAAPAYTPHVPAFTGTAASSPGRCAKSSPGRAGCIPHRVVRTVIDDDCALCARPLATELSPSRVSCRWTFASAGDDRIRRSLERPAASERHERIRSMSDSPVRSSAMQVRHPNRRALLEPESGKCSLGALEQRAILSLVADFYAESYVQHNTDMPGGYARIRQVVESDIRQVHLKSTVEGRFRWTCTT